MLIAFFFIFIIAFWIAVAVMVVGQSAAKSKANSLAVELGYNDYRDAVVQLGFAQSRPISRVPPGDVLTALQSEKARRGAEG